MSEDTRQELPNLHLAAKDERNIRTPTELYLNSFMLMNIPKLKKRKSEKWKKESLKSKKNIQKVKKKHKIIRWHSVNFSD